MKTKLLPEKGNRSKSINPQRLIIQSLVKWREDSLAWSYFTNYSGILNFKNIKKTKLASLLEDTCTFRAYTYMNLSSHYSFYKIYWKCWPNIDLRTVNQIYIKHSFSYEGSYVIPLLLLFNYKVWPKGISVGSIGRQTILENALHFY